MSPLLSLLCLPDKLVADGRYETLREGNAGIDGDTE